MLGCSQLLFLGSAAWLPWFRSHKKNKHHGRKLLPSSAAAWLSDPGFLKCCTRSTGSGMWVFALARSALQAFEQTCAWCCALVEFICTYVLIQGWRNSFVQLYTEPLGLLRPAGFNASPSLVAGMSWQDLSSWEPLLCLCLSEQREGRTGQNDSWTGWSVLAGPHPDVFSCIQV